MMYRQALRDFPATWEPAPTATFPELRDAPANWTAGPEWDAPEPPEAN